MGWNPNLLSECEEVLFLTCVYGICPSEGVYLHTKRPRTWIITLSHNKRRVVRSELCIGYAWNARFISGVLMSTDKLSWTMEHYFELSSNMIRYLPYSIIFVFMIATRNLNGFRFPISSWSFAQWVIRSVHRGTFRLCLNEGRSKSLMATSYVSWMHSVMSGVWRIETQRALVGSSSSLRVVSALLQNVYDNFHVWALSRTMIAVVRKLDLTLPSECRANVDELS